uniref:Uncharacterized protein n=1 Tax=Romanomermis culicivorax TaxID=13658 RepID=A0A915HSP0_ROMCU
MSPCGPALTTFCATFGTICVLVFQGPAAKMEDEFDVTILPPSDQFEASDVEDIDQDTLAPDVTNLRASILSKALATPSNLSKNASSKICSVSPPTRSHMATTFKSGLNCLAASAATVDFLLYLR